MKSIHRAAASALVGALTLAGSLLTVPAAGAASGHCTSTTISGSARVTYCSYATGSSKHFKVADSDGVYNKTSSTATLKCTITKRATVSASLSTSVSASVKAGIVAEAKAEVGTTLSGSVSTEKSIEVGVKVKPHKTVLCQRGIYYYTVKGKTVKTVQSLVTGKKSSSTTVWTYKAPSSKAWRLIEQ